MMRPLLLAACAQALLTPSPVRPVATRLRARTADGMSKGWKVLRLSEEEGNAISLAANSNEWGTKEIEVEIPRSAESPGIGILLEEFGANDAGEGLTLVAGLVDGGNAARSGLEILPGDAIIRADGANVEGLSYDRTVDALGAMAPAPAPARLTLKRLLKIPKVTLTAMFPPEENEPNRVINWYPRRGLRETLLVNKIDVGGTCTEDMQCLLRCSCVVRKGRALLEDWGIQEKQMLEKKEPDWRLTCRACLPPLEEDGEMTIRIRPDTENVLRRKGGAYEYKFKM